MAHGISLQMRYIGRAAPGWVHRHPAPVAIRLRGKLVGYAKPGGMTAYRNPDKDRSLAGKARIRARRAGAR